MTAETTENRDGETTVAKRKLSTSATSQDQGKRSKVDDKQPLLEDLKDEKSGKVNSDTEKILLASTGNEVVKENPKGHKPLMGKGSRTYYGWADGIYGLFGVGDVLFLVPKSQFDIAYSRTISTSDTTEKDESDDDWEPSCDVEKIELFVDEEDSETEGAKELEKVWREVVKGRTWYYEITLQMEEPESGKPAMKVELGWGYNPEEDDTLGKDDKKERNAAQDEGSKSEVIRWITGFGVPDEESLKGLEFLKDRVWDGRGPGSP